MIKTELLAVSGCIGMYVGECTCSFYFMSAFTAFHSSWLSVHINVCACVCVCVCVSVCV